MSVVAVGSKGVDFSYSPRPTAEVLLRNGYVFAVGYISPNPSKNVTRSQVDGLVAGGVDVFLVWEISSTRPAQGHTAGVADGAAAKAQALALGYPTGLVLLAAVDTDTYYANIAQHQAYLEGFAAACAPYGMGVYGDADILIRVGSLCRLGWLPNASGWQSAATRAAAIALKLVHVLQGRTTVLDGKYTTDANSTIQVITGYSKTVTPPVPIPPDFGLFGDNDSMTECITPSVGDAQRSLWNGFVIYDIPDNETGLRLVEAGFITSAQYTTPRVVPAATQAKFRRV